MAWKKVEPITRTENGEIVFNLAADEANANWLLAARLRRLADEGDEEARAKLEKMMEAPMYEWEPDPENK